MFQTTNEMILLQYMLLSGTSVFPCPDHQNPSDMFSRVLVPNHLLSYLQGGGAGLKRSEGKETSGICWDHISKRGRNLKGQKDCCNHKVMRKKPVTLSSILNMNRMVLPGAFISPVLSLFLALTHVHVDPCCHVDLGWPYDHKLANRIVIPCLGTFELA